MKNTIDLTNNKKYFIKKDAIVYTMQEICPCCGRYTPDGDICSMCLSKYDLVKPKPEYCEL